MSDRTRKYYRDYYREVRGPKTAASKAVAAATCQICGDEWATTYAGWAEIFVCSNCYTKLFKWDREKEMARRQMEAACKVCHVDPATTIHESSQLRCCLTCSAWLSEGEAKGSQQRWGPSQGDPWDEDGKLGHIFEQSAQFHGPNAVASLCGVKAPIWPMAMDMIMPAALRRFGLCVACLKACPDPEHLFNPRHQYVAYVVPTDVLGRMNVAVGTS